MAAAAASQFGNLKEETSCSICLEYFSDPVTIDCGHNFCRSCITQSWQGRDENFPCPQCRETCPVRSLRPNRQLGNIVEIAKHLHLPPVKPREETLCEKHEERLRLFCEEEQTMICWVCRESKDHKTHSASPIEEAAEEYKHKVRDERMKIASEFQQLHRLLKEKEQTLHERLEQMEKKITKVENANIENLSNQITSLNALITEIEKKSEEPAWELLKDVRRTLSRCINVTFQDPAQLIKKYEVAVTLDPDTAHPQLVLSENQRHVRVTNIAKKSLPDTPKRSTGWWNVLGSEGFTAGRHYWEVELVQEKGQWYVGVSADSVNRKSNFKWLPEMGIWAVSGNRGQYSVLNSSQTRLSPQEKPKKLGVYLDYEGGQLSMYNADSLELLYTFPSTLFAHRLFPIFNLWEGAELRLV